MSEWVSVKDKLPKNNQRVLAFESKRNEVYLMEFIEIPDERKYDFCFEEYGTSDRRDVWTHWMPLPEPPNNETKV